MKSFSFKEVIRLQFNALMMITIKGTLKQKRKLLARRFKQEVLFCEMGEAKLNEQDNVDKYSCDATTFPVLHFTVQVSDEKISTALSKLSEKQREFILLYYFHDMSDKEIAKLYHVSRSAVGYTRNKGLEKILNFYDDYISKLCLRPFCHEKGNVSMQVDEEWKGEIQTAMVKAMLKFELKIKK